MKTIEIDDRWLFRVTTADIGTVVERIASSMSRRGFLRFPRPKKPLTQRHLSHSRLAFWVWSVDGLKVPAISEKSMSYSKVVIIS